jgi:hypothetical protein
VPLFIVAATACRFVDDPNWNPRDRLETFLNFPNVGQLENMEQTYLPVLTQLPAALGNSRDRDRLYRDVRLILGAIATLAEPLSVASLAALLGVSQELIVLRLRPLQSVVQVPTDFVTPIRALHSSFIEFILSDRLRHEPFGVDGAAAHCILLSKCISLLSSPNGLQKNMCGLTHPGQPRREIPSTIIEERLPPAVQYACRYWVRHVQGSEVRICDNNEVHKFLQNHFLHWLEALSMIDRVAEAIENLHLLQSLVSVSSL